MAEEIQAEQLEELKNKWLRALADFDNYKKRTALEQDQFVKFSNEGLIRELLPVLDGLDKALSAAGTSKVNDGLIKGLALVGRQLKDALSKFGLDEIAAVGKPYDANLHEAILQKESSGPENVILEEMQKGYTLHGRVIKPSMVIVSKKGEK
ncbi:nucleotide exchange factor GrpE [Candidatus Saganbacteria bacterium]|nr:nucleotide exchange factor GrpE [Candidatus Saganbacteria bacterium]